MTPEISFRPTVFSVFNVLSESASFELLDHSGAVFLSNCHIPLEGKVAFRQVLNAESLFDATMRHGLEVEIAEKDFDWMSLELHVPMSALEGRETANIVITARADLPTVLSLGYGGVLDRDRGFDCFVFRDHKVGQQYKTISTELQFSALPVDEIENDKFVVAIYFNNSDETTLTISDFRLDLL